MSLGVRVVVEDEQGRILLVRHTYLSGWHLPGGGVDPGESTEAAALRELREETGLVATARPRLFGLYRHTAAAGRDHIAVYRLAQFDRLPDAPADAEIAETRFVSRDGLPADTTRSTRARFAEMFDGAPAQRDLVSRYFIRRGLGPRDLGSREPVPRELAPKAQDRVPRAGRERPAHKVA